MIPEQLPNADKSREYEQKPKVLLTVHGQIHESLNLQGVPEILDAFGNHLDTHEGKKVLYKEAAGLSPEKARLLHKDIDRQGFTVTLLETVLIEKLGRFPKKNEIKDLSYRIERHAKNDVKRILDLGLLTIDDIQSYFLYIGLDRLRIKHNFDIVFETHGPSVLTEDENQDRLFSELTLKATESWNKGKFDNSIMETKSAHSSMGQGGLLRERDMTVQLLQIAESLLLQEKGGSLFVLVGEAHLPIAETLRANLGDHASVKYQRNVGVHENLQLGKIVRGIRSEELVSDEIYMQSLIVSLVLSKILTQSISQGTISTLTVNYQTLLHKLQTAASGISIEKGRELCEKQIPLYDLLLKQ